MTYTLNNEESEILEAYNNKTLKKASKSSGIKNKLNATARNTISKMETLNIKLPSHEVHKLKVKSLATGVPVENLISVIVQNYFENQLTIKL